MGKCLYYTKLCLLLLVGDQSGAQQAFTPDTIAALPLISTSEKQIVSAENFSRFLPSRAKQTVLVRTVSPVLLDSLKKSEEYWYANAAQAFNQPAVQKKSEKKTNWLQPWMRSLLWAFLLASFTGVIIGYLYSAKFFFWRHKAVSLKVDGVATVDHNDLFAIHFTEAINNAEKEENYQQAIRLWYAQSLKKLVANRKIVFHSGQTNQQVLAQLKDTKEYSSFLRLTRIFEYTCYGGFSVSGEDYRFIKKQFVAFQKEDAYA